MEYQPTATIERVNFGPYTLPSNADNQPVVQIRWVYYFVSGNWSVTNNRTHRVILDDILVSSKPIITFADRVLCTTALVNLTASPAGGTFTGPGVYGSQFTADTIGSGVYQIEYSYTDPFGNSNSKIVTYTAHESSCTTKLNSNWCGATELQLNNVLVAQQIRRASDYEWEFTNVNTGVKITRLRGLDWRTMNMSLVVGLEYEQSYYVRIRSLVNGIWSNYGDTCLITTRPFNTKVRNDWCGASNVTLGDVIFADAIGLAQNYEWRFTNAALNYTFTRRRGSSSQSMPLNLITGLLYGYTYNVEVRVQVNNVWSPFGQVCQIHMAPNVPLTQLNSIWCGASGLTTSSSVVASSVAMAVDYEWYFYNTSLGYQQYKLKGGSSHGMALISIPGLVDGETYHVQVRAKLANGQWGTFGPICQITLDGNRMMVLPEEIIKDDNGSASEDLELAIYPNPIHDLATLRIENLAGDEAQIIVLDMEGRLVEAIQWNGGNGEIAMTNLSSLASGMYVIRVSNPTQTKTIRFIKQ